MKYSLLMLLALGACTTPGGPPSDAFTLTVTSCKNIDAAIVATDAAVVSGALKGDAARNALKGLTAAQAGRVAALASVQSASTPASGATK